MNDWREVLSAARNEYRELVQQRDVIDADQADLDVRREKVEKRILQLQKTIESLSELLGESRLAKTLSERLPLGGAYDNLKLAEAVRKVLQSADRYWSPIEVREALQVQQYDLSGYTNVLASIHAVLKRIFESGDAVRMPGGDGKAMYRWRRDVAVTPEPAKLKIETFPPNVRIEPVKPIEMLDKEGKPKRVIK